MNRIALIMPHFGHFNNYFKFWLRSCCNNPKIDFLIFTDDSNAIASRIQQASAKLRNVFVKALLWC